VRKSARFYGQVRSLDAAGRRKIQGIGPRRAELIVAGAAVFLRILELFHQPALHYSAAGVRDGNIADLAARGVGRELTMLDREQRRFVEQMARVTRAASPCPQSGRAGSPVIRIAANRCIISRRRWANCWKRRATA